VPLRTAELPSGHWALDPTGARLLAGEISAALGAVGTAGAGTAPADIG
jgi:hypothetical protein